jgi:dTDP-glucose 4,6-dehydratase
MDSSRIEGELGWRPLETFESGLLKTIRWYMDNPSWVESVRTGTYREWMKTQYGL